MNAFSLHCIMALLLCLPMTGCFRIQTQYYHGQTSGTVVDALTQKPIANALVRFHASEERTTEAGAFRFQEKTDWTTVMFLGERIYTDSPGTRVLSISAPGYMPRFWAAPYSPVYPFPIRLLPENCGLRYTALRGQYPKAEDAEQNYQSVEPTPDETFLPLPPPEQTHKATP